MQARENNCAENVRESNANERSFFYDSLKNLGRKVFRFGLAGLVAGASYIYTSPSRPAYAVVTPPAGLTEINAWLMDKSTYDAGIPVPPPGTRVYVDDPSVLIPPAQDTPLDLALVDLKTYVSSQADPNSYLVKFKILTDADNSRSYASHRASHTANYNMELYGDGQNASAVELSLIADKFLYIHDIRGGTGPNFGFFVQYNSVSSGGMENSYVERTINFSQAANIAIENNTISNFDSDATVIVTGPLSKDLVDNIATFRYNDINGTIGFQLQRNAVLDLGTDGTSGNNILNFSNTAILGMPSFNGTVIADGDAWVGTVAKSGKDGTTDNGLKATGYLTDIPTIHTQLVDNQGSGTITITNPLGFNPTTDNDGDGLNNGIEITLGTNMNLADSDSDGYNDFNEVNRDGNPDNYDNVIDTNPNNPDTDGDGANDGYEVTQGTNPLDDQSFPPTPSLPVGKLVTGLSALALAGAGAYALSRRDVIKGLIKKII
ncbi:hypothetical protein J4466_00480 [Candidatus Pacearchaeota archaeon]|nr:hypothetical protein [Candidatus Pacearchaeota archaeon]